MRTVNRIFLIFLAALMLAVVARLAVWQQQNLLPETPEETPTETPKPTETPTPPSALLGKLRITELMEKNRTVVPDEDGDFPDWIELMNVSGETVSLEGCHIADRENRWGWVFPARELAPGERLLIFASRKDRGGEELHTDFALSEYDCLFLYDSEDLLVDSAACAGCEADVSLALNAKGEWAASLYPTPGEENTAAGYDRYQQTLSPAGPLVINEAAVRNLGLKVAGNAGESDWVEIKNISEAPVRLSDYYLSDRDENLRLWQLPAQELRPGATVIFVCDSSESGFYGTTPCTGFALNSSYEQLYLTDSEGVVIDRVNLRDIPSGGSYGRMDGEPGFFFFAKPSPGKENSGGMSRVSAMPVALTKDGVFEGVESVTLELAGEGTLRYTINNSAPTAESELYTGPIEITKTCVVSVKSFEEGALPSRTLALSFIINEGHTLPVVSLVAENFKEFTGMFNSGVKSQEQPCSLSLYRDGDSFTINCGVMLNGETSLVLPKKNMSLRFRGPYGKAALDYDIFGGGAASFTDLLLRAGQDQNDCVIRNELAQSLAEKANLAVINQRSIFCVLYIDGEYKGIYTLKERPNASLYAAVADVDPDSVEIFEAPAPFKSEFYADTVQFVNKNDMRLEENYAQLRRVINIDSLIDWLFMEGFCANTDITSGNLRYARSYQADGRWHLLFYDLDATFRSFSSIQTNLLTDFAANRIQVAVFSVPLMKNPDFRDRFLTRAAELLRGPLTNEAVLAEIDRMADEIRPEIPRDFARTGKDLRSWEKAIDFLKSMVRDKDWRQANIDAICKDFDLSSEERAQYFGDIDGAPRA